MLKLLACLFMLIDHIGHYFADFMPSPVYLLLRCIGRLAFPIFAWSVARGCVRTRNPLHYFLRMLFFAIPTEILIRLVDRLPDVPEYIGNGTNVMVTFTLAIALVFGYQLATRSIRDMMVSLRPIAPTHNTLPTAPRYDVRVNLGGIELDSRLGLILGVLAMALACTGTLLLKPDYGFYGIGSVLLFFIIHERFPEKDWPKRALQGFLLLNLAYLGIMLITRGLAMSFGAVIQCLAVLAVPICYISSQSHRPGPFAKYAVYAFYPLHILALALIHYLFF